MVNYGHPYDPDGNLATNMVKDESHPLATYYNPWHCIIPLSAPFYRNDLILTDGETGRTLNEGIDYYLGHRFGEAANINKQPIFGSIMLTAYDEKKSVIFKQYRAMGGPNSVSRKIALEYLAKDFKDPRNCDWSELLKFAVEIPPVDHSGSLDEAIKNDLVTGALDRLHKAIKDSLATSDAMYDKFIALLDPLERQIDDWHFTNHQYQVGNTTHGVTLANTGTLDVKADVQNTLLAYGKSLAELTAIIKELNLTQKELDAYYLLAGDDVYGRIVVSETEVSLKNPNGATTVDLRDGNVILSSLGSATMTAWATQSGDQGALELIAGMNGLSINGTVADKVKRDKGAIYNGFYLIHAGNVKDYMPVVDPNKFYLRTESNDNIALSGLGREDSKLVANITFILATETVYGLHRIGSGKYARKDVSAAPAFVKRIADYIKTLADKTITINGQSLAANITLTATHLGLGNVTNTADHAKPVSKPMSDALALKAKDNHTHDINDVSGIAYASATTKGLVKLDSAIGSVVTDKAATPSTIFEGAAQSVEAFTEVDQRIPNDVIDVMQYAGFGYLPVPVQGSYEGSGPNYSQRACAGFVDVDDTMIVFRNGADVEGTGVFYTSAKIRPDGTLTPLASSATRYAPNGLASDEYIANTYRGSNDGMLVLIQSTTSSATQYALILFNGTGDAAKHQVIRFIDQTNYFGFSAEMTPHIVKGNLVIIHHRVDSAGIGLRMYVDNLEYVKSQYSYTPTVVTNINGKTFFNNDIVPNSDKWAMLVNGGIRTTGQTTEAVIERRWETSMNVRHNGMFIDVAVSGDTLRCYYGCHNYESTATGSGSCSYAISYDINVVTGHVVVEPTKFPIIAASRTSWTGEALASLATNCPNRWGNTHCGMITNGKYFISWSTDNTAQPNVEAFKFTSNKSRWDMLLRKNRGVTGIGRQTLVGNFGSVSKDPAYAWQPLMKNRAYILSGSFQVVEYIPNQKVGTMKANGPTANRVLDNSGSRLKRAVYITDGTTESMSGGTFWNGNLTGWTTIADDLTTSGTISISQAQFDAVTAKAKADFNTIETSQDLNAAPSETAMQVMVYVPHLATLPVLVVTVVQYKLASGSRRQRSSGYTAQCTNRTGDIGTVSNMVSVFNDLVSDAGTGISGPQSWANGGVQIFIDNVGKAASININYAPYHSQVGAGQNGTGMLLLWDMATNAKISGVRTRPGSYNANGRGVDKNYGVLNLRSNSGKTAIIGDSIGKTKAQWIANTTVESIVLHTSQVAAGWFIYFTEEIDFFTSTVNYKMPKITVDVRVEFPGNYTNKTFYIYATLDAGVPKYEFTLERTQDSTDRLYIGFCVTDSVRITRLEVSRATRLGNLREMEEHYVSPESHGLNRLTGGKLGLSLTPNLPSLHDFNGRSIVDQYPSYTKTSHKVGGGVAADGQWALSGSDVTYVENTTSAAFLINKQKYGNYKLIVDLSSTSTDNDPMGVLLAYRKVGSVEHTLTLVRKFGDNTSEAVAVYYNYNQDTQAIIWEGGTTVASNWSAAGTSRVVVNRNTLGEFSITVGKFTNLSNDESISTDITFDQLPIELQVGEVNYGYMTHGQPRCTFKHNYRPEDDMSNYLATLAMAAKVADRTDAGVTVLTGTISDGQTVPIPAGFTASDCQFYVTMPVFDTGTVDQIDGWKCYAYSDRRASISVKGESAGSGGAHRGVAGRFLVIGVKP